MFDKIQDNGFTINPLKRKCEVKETNWLGYWSTLVGIEMQQRKVQGIANMELPQNIKQLCSF